MLWTRRKNFTFRRQRAALECLAFPVNRRGFRAPEVWLALILDSRTIHGTRWVLQERFWKCLCQRMISPSLPSDPNNLESSYREGVPGTTMGQAEGLRRELQSWTVPTLRFVRNRCTWDSMHQTLEELILKITRSKLWEFAISELHVGQFLDPDDFHYLRVNFNTDVCVGVHSSFSWQCRGSIKWRNPLTISSRCILVNLEETSLILRWKDCEDCACVEKSHIQYFSHKKESVWKRQMSQKYSRFLGEKQMAYNDLWPIYNQLELLRQLKVYRFCSIFCSQSDVLDFDTRYDQILLGTSEMPLENVLEGLY